MSKTISVGGIVLAAMLLSPMSALSQNFPLPAQLDAGAAQRRSLEQRKELEHKDEAEEIIGDPLKVENLSRPQKTTAPQASFVLKGVRINDSAFLGRDELTKIVRPFVGETVSFAVLEEMVAQVNAAYQAHGVGTAQAILPPQEVVDGIVRIELVEGRLGQVRLSGNAYTKDGFILDRMELEKGAVVDTHALEEALVRFNRTSDIQLKAALQPGESYGATDLELVVQEPKRNSFQFFLDNQGIKSTGNYQLGMFARNQGLLGWDDQSTLYLVGSEGTLTGSLGYSIPVNRRNGRLGVTYARNKLEIVKGPFKTLNIQGNSSTTLLSFQQPLRIDARSKWDMSLSVAKSDSEMRFSDLPFSESSVTKFSIGTSYDRNADWGRWTTSHIISNARVKSSMEEWPAISAYTGSANILWPLKGCCTVVVNTGWQWLNADQAPGSELFQIGGLNSVRGYELGVLAATRGYYAQFEAHRPFSENMSGFAFVDFGGVMPEPKERIVGGGVGITYRYDKRWNLTMSYSSAFNKVVPDQDSGRLDARLVLSF